MAWRLRSSGAQIVSPYFETGKCPILSRPRTRLSSVPRPRRMGLHLRGRRLQSGTETETDGGAVMSAARNCRLIGRWRIVEADLWGRDYLDLVEAGTITIRANGFGEITFGAMQAGLDLAYSTSSVSFTWSGCDEWTRSQVTFVPNCSTAARSRSLSLNTMATRPS